MQTRPSPILQTNNFKVNDRKSPQKFTSPLRLRREIFYWAQYFYIRALVQKEEKTSAPASEKTLTAPIVDFDAVQLYFAALALRVSTLVPTVFQKSNSMLATSKKNWANTSGALGRLVPSIIDNDVKELVEFVIIGSLCLGAFFTTVEATIQQMFD